MTARSDRPNPNRERLVLLRGGLDDRALSEEMEWASFCARIGWNDDAPELDDDYEARLAAHVFGAAPWATSPATHARPVGIETRPTLNRAIAGASLAILCAAAAAAVLWTVRSPTSQTTEADIVREAPTVTAAPSVVPVDSALRRIEHPEEIDPSARPVEPRKPQKKPRFDHPGWASPHEDGLRDDVARSAPHDDESGPTIVAAHHVSEDGGLEGAPSAKGAGIGTSHTLRADGVLTRHLSSSSPSPFIPAVAFEAAVALPPTASLASGPTAIASVPHGRASHSETASADWSVSSRNDHWVGVSVPSRADGLPAGVGVMAELDLARAFDQL